MRLSNKYAAHTILVLGVLIAAMIVVVGGAFPALAQEETPDEDVVVAEPTLYAETEEVQEAPKEITFPIKELGGCESKDACKTYCNNPDNISACASFAEAHGLMKKEQAEVAREFARAVKTEGGPGGCKGVNSCRTYCENTERLEECIAFAEEHGYTDKGMEEGKKIAAYLKGGGTMPGGCNSRKSCETYCRDIERLEECTAFAEQAGLEQGVGPDGKPFDRERILKIKELMESGQMPGACTSKEECEAYCHDQTHAEECLAFAQKSGMISPGDAERAKKFSMQGGPGGCTSKNECENFCHTPENREICYAFAKEQGLISSEQEQRFGEIRRNQSEVGSKMATCVRSKVEAAMTSDGPPGQEIINAAMQECGQEFGGAGFGGEGFGGEGMGSDQGQMPSRMMDPRMMNRPTEGQNMPMSPEEFKKQYNEQYTGRMMQQGIPTQGMPPKPGMMPANPTFDDGGIGEDALPVGSDAMYPNSRPMPPPKPSTAPGMPSDTYYYYQNASGNAPANAPGNAPGNYPQNAQGNTPANAPANAPYNSTFNKPVYPPMPTGTMMPPSGGAMPSGASTYEPRMIPAPGFSEPGMTAPSGSGGMMMPPPGGAGSGSMMPPGGAGAPPPGPQTNNAFSNMVANVFTVIYSLYGVR